jgi:hypothetical protein
MLKTLPAHAVPSASSAKVPMGRIYELLLLCNLDYSAYLKK